MNWFKKPLNIGITIFVAAMALVAIGSIIFGVTTHSEPGLLKACEQDGGLVYAKGSSIERAQTGECETPVDIVWARKRIPLKVDWGALRDSDDHAVRAALNDINSQLGFRMLSEAAPDELVDIAVDLEVVEGGADAPPGWASHRIENGELLCKAAIRSTLVSDRMVYLVAHHELLHCIGLAHDQDNPSSAIYPFTRDDTMERVMNAARITDFDRSTLRRLYHE